MKNSAYGQDLDLVLACLDQDVEAWERLFRQHSDTVSFAIHHTLRLHRTRWSEEQIAETQSEVFFRLVRSDFARLRTYSGRCSLKHWLKVVTGNFVVDTLRRKRPDCSLDDPELAGVANSLADDGPDPEARFQTEEAAALLRSLCATLPASDQKFVILYYEQGLSHEEVAEALQTSVGAVYSRKNRVRHKLTELLERHMQLTERRRTHV